MNTEKKLKTINKLEKTSEWSFKSAESLLFRRLLFSLIMKWQNWPKNPRFMHYYCGRSALKEETSEDTGTNSIARFILNNIFFHWKSKKYFYYFILNTLHVDSPCGNADDRHVELDIAEGHSLPCKFSLHIKMFSHFSVQTSIFYCEFDLSCSICPSTINFQSISTSGSKDASINQLYIFGIPFSLLNLKENDSYFIYFYPFSY